MADADDVSFQAVGPLDGLDGGVKAEGEVAQGVAALDEVFVAFDLVGSGEFGEADGEGESGSPEGPAWPSGFFSPKYR